MPKASSTDRQQSVHDYSADERLAVYGSLAPGERNARLLASAQGFWTRGRVRGELVSQGWASRESYKGIRLAAQSDEVGVLLFSSHQLPKMWADLDAFEGSDYRRVPVEVRTAEGTVAAHIYELSAI